MKRNQAEQIIVNENDILDAIYSNKNIHTCTVEDSSWLVRYNTLCKQFEIDDEIKYNLATELPLSEYVAQVTSEQGWNMPDSYKGLEIYSTLIGKCHTQAEKDRVDLEMREFEARGMIPVLKFLVYFVDTMRKNNLVWGVGRGSSVASYVLYLIGIHKVDSLKYNLDIKEFLK